MRKHSDFFYALLYPLMSDKKYFLYHLPYLYVVNSLPIIFFHQKHALVYFSFCTKEKDIRTKISKISWYFSRLLRKNKSAYPQISVTLPSIPLEKQKKSIPSFSKKKNTINIIFYKIPPILCPLLKNNYWPLFQPIRSTSINTINNQAILNIPIKIIKKRNPEQIFIYSESYQVFTDCKIKLLLQQLRKEFQQKLPCEV